MGDRSITLRIQPEVKSRVLDGLKAEILGVDQAAKEAAESVSAIGSSRAATNASGSVDALAESARNAGEGMGRLRDQVGRFVAGQGGAAGAAKALTTELQRMSGIDLSNVVAQIGELGLARASIQGYASDVISATTALVNWGVGQAFINDGLIQMRNRLRNVTQGYDEMNKAAGLTLSLANRTNTDWDVTVDVFSRVSRVTNTLGFTMERTGRFAETLTKMFSASGKSATENASAMLQLSQALGSGVLQGDEFRSIAESAPQLLDAFAEKLGVTRGELKKLASEGKISTDVMIAGIEDMAVRADAAFQAMEKTFSQRMQPTLNALKEDPRALSKAVSDPTALWDLAGNSPTEFAEGLGLTSIADRIGVDFANQTMQVSEFNKEIGRMTREVGDLAKAMGGATEPTKTWAQDMGDLVLKATALNPPVKTFNETIAEAKSLIPSTVEGWEAGFSKLGDVLDDVGDRADKLISKLLGDDFVKGRKLVGDLFGQGAVDALQGLSVAGEQAQGGWAMTGEDPLERGKRELAASKRGGPKNTATHKKDPWSPTYSSEAVQDIDQAIAAVKLQIEGMNQAALFDQLKSELLEVAAKFKLVTNAADAARMKEWNLELENHAKGVFVVNDAYEEWLRTARDGTSKLNLALTDINTNALQQLKSAVFQIGDAFADAFAGAELSGKKMVQALLRDFARLSMRSALQGLAGLAGAFGGGGVLSATGSGATLAPGVAQLPGYATGGVIPPSLRMGYRNGTDSQVLAIRRSPDETVRIHTPSQDAAFQAAMAGGMAQMGGSKQPIHITMEQGRDEAELENFVIRVITRNPHAIRGAVTGR